MYNREISLVYLVSNSDAWVDLDTEPVTITIDESHFFKSVILQKKTPSSTDSPSNPLMLSSKEAQKNF